MMADKSGLRRKPKPGTRKPSKFTDQDLIEMNRAAGRRLMERMAAEGKLTPKEVAEMVRKEIKQ